MCLLHLFASSILGLTLGLLASPMLAGESCPTAYAGPGLTYAGKAPSVEPYLDAVLTLNRNPYIDHPDLVCRAWAAGCP